MRIDAHQHFWNYTPQRDTWINEEMKLLQRDFLPHHLKPLLDQNGMQGCVAVQADPSEAENDFLLTLAEKHAFIKGVVGWVDLTSTSVEERLQFYQQYKIMKGFRSMLQGERERDCMLRADFKRGIGQLARYNFTFDLLIFSDQLPYVRELIACFPDQLFVIDHLAKPPIKAGDIEKWKKEIAAIASFENVYCKLSGMTTEADWQRWTSAMIRPFMDVVVEAFGTKRILYGSDWPVCLLAGSYERTHALVADYFSSFSKHEQELFFGGNAARFYYL